jgi:DNA-binding response OmpR family regulator
MVTLHTLPYLIGRGLTNQLRVEHPDVSRRHACVHLLDDYYAVEDLGSRNGTLVNGARLAAGEQRRLRDGDTIQLASALSLVFVDPFITRQQPDLQPLSVHGLWLDTEAQVVLLGNQRITLPVLQHRLLALLYARPGLTMTRSEIAKALWSTDVELTEQMIDNTVSRLRANLQKYDASHEYIVTVRGRGYQFVQMPRAKD